MPATPEPRPDAVAAAVVAAVAADGAADARVAVEYLSDFLAVLAGAVVAGEPVPPARLRAYRGVGDRAAVRGVALRALLDLYLSAAWRLWRHLPPVAAAADDPAAVVTAGEVMLRAVDDVVAALTEGYQLARRSLTRAQESARREFVDDLLGGSGDVVGVLRRADGFGLDLSGPHAVVCVAAGRPFVDGTPLPARIERAVAGSKGDAQPLVASKDGRLVVVFAAPDTSAVEHVTERIGATLDAGRGARGSVGVWRLAVGRAAAGPDGVLTSYREALDALDLADRLSLPDRVVRVRDLLVYRVLLRDRVALADLVEDTLGPLRAVRGGAQPLVDTVLAYVDTGGNAAAAARRLHLSVRAVTYRLEKLREVTGLDPDVGADRLALHVAALGARVIEWDAPSLLPETGSEEPH